MSCWHIVIEDDEESIVGQFNVGSESRREYIYNNLPSDLSIRNERRIPDGADLGNSLSALSDNVVDWDDRLEQL